VLSNNTGAQISLTVVFNDILPCIMTERTPHRCARLAALGERVILDFTEMVSADSTDTCDMFLDNSFRLMLMDLHDSTMMEGGSFPNGHN
jgi:hypothetical protein